MTLRSLALAGSILTALTLAACSDDDAEDVENAVEEGAEDVMEGGAEVLDEGADALNEGAAALEDDAPAMEGEPPAMEGGAPAMEGEPPAMEGGAPAMEGEAPAMEGEAPAMEGEAPAMAGEAPAEDAAPAEDVGTLTLADFTGEWGETAEACANDPLVIAEDVVTAGGTECDVTSTEELADGVGVTLVCTVGNEAQTLNWTVAAVGDAPFDAVNITAGDETTAFSRCE